MMFWCIKVSEVREQSLSINKSLLSHLGHWGVLWLKSLGSSKQNTWHNSLPQGVLPLIPVSAGACHIGQEERDLVNPFLHMDDDFDDICGKGE